jgi:lactate permease
MNLHNIIQLFLAALPIIVVLILMISFHWPGSKAGPAGWLVALIVAVLFFGLKLDALAYSQTKSMLMSIYVLYIIWMALIFYYINKEAGAIDCIGSSISFLTKDRVLQLIILSWVFSSFLQGIAGYGVPIAIVAPLLIALGFDPVVAVISVAVGHSWSVTFGSIAASFNTMVTVSGIDGAILAPGSALLLGVACILCGIAAVLSYQGWKSVRHGLPAILILGTVMAGVQYIAAISQLSNIAAFLAGAAGLCTSFLVAQMRCYRNSEFSDVGLNSENTSQKMPIILATSGYLVLILIVGIAEMVPAVGNFLDQIKISFNFPQTTTALGFVVEAGKGQKISILGHAGALLLYASILSFVIFSRAGRLKPGALSRIFKDTSKSGLTSSIGIVSMVGFAMIMEQSGMTAEIAQGLSHAGEQIYPLLSPFIGLLGTFMTGSNTNSNIVFTSLQKQTAGLLNLPAAIILAAQTTGGSIGGMLAPARIIVGCSTAGLAGKEGLVLKKTIRYGLIITLIIGACALLIIKTGLYKYF